MTPAPYAPGSYLVVETTNLCSLACVHCTVSEPGHPHHARTGFMPLDLALRLFTQLEAVGARFDTLIPFWLGEPLLHPEFGAFYQAALRTAVGAGTFGRIEVHTNATHLDAERVRVAVNAAPVPQTWHCTLDAATAGTYRAIKGADRYDEVCARVEALLTEKARRGAPNPRVVLQYIVSSRNASEIPAFRARWDGVCRRLGLPVTTAAQAVPPGEDVVLFFRQLDSPTPAAQARENEVYRRAMIREGIGLPLPEQTPTRVEGPNTAVCGCFWKSPVVGWDGRVTTCTRDNRHENTLGSLYDRTFPELWWGDRMARTRAQVGRGDYAGLPPCAGCYIPRSANYAGITQAEREAYR